MDPMLEMVMHMAESQAKTNASIVETMKTMAEQQLKLLELIDSVSQKLVDLKAEISTRGTCH